MGVKKYAYVTIKNSECTKRIDIDITECQSLEDIFLVVEDVIRKNNIMAKGDKLDYINFYEEEVLE